MDSQSSATNNMVVHIVEKPMHVNELIMVMYNSPSKPVYEHFKIVNAHIKNDQVNAGQVVLLSPANSMECTRDEVAFLEFANRVDKHLESLSKQERILLAKRYDLISNVAGYNGAFVGFANNAWKAQVNQVEAILRELERLYSSSYSRTGKLNNKQFFTKRTVLFQRLDTVLQRFGQPALSGALTAGDVRRNLGLSSKSIVHQWKKGYADVDKIPGFDKHYAKITRMTKNLNRVGYIGMGLAVVDAEANIQKACLTGNEEMCIKSKYTQRGKAVGSIGGGIIGGTVAYSACNLVFGIPSAGTSFLWCGIVATSVGGYAGGKIAGDYMEGRGQVLYEVTR